MDKVHGGSRHGSGPRMSLRLDELLGELHARLETVVSTPDRVHALLQAVVSIGGDLDLQTVLRRIVDAAAALSDARYGALGVIGSDGDHLTQFVTTGIDDDGIAAIGQWPHGHGILGLLIKKPQPIRLADISAHPESAGFPAGHPAMRSFLGVPIRVRNEVFGNLYLAEKAGGAEFDDEDKAVVNGLATAAGVAIENARLFQQSRRRESWQRASADISTGLLSGMPLLEVLQLITRRARELCEADLATLSLADPSGEHLDVLAADGEFAADFRGLRLPLHTGAAGSVSAAVYREGRSRLVENAHRAATAAGAPSRVPIGPALVVPLGPGTAILGVLSVANHAGRPVFSHASLDLLEPFAAQAAIALELAERRADAERLGVLEDRDRIARDLHDTVIQQLFATGMSLTAVLKTDGGPDVTQRIEQALDDLDATVRTIHSAISDLRSDR